MFFCHGPNASKIEIYPSVSGRQSIILLLTFQIDAVTLLTPCCSFSNLFLNSRQKDKYNTTHYFNLLYCYNMKISCLGLLFPQLTLANT